MWMSFRCQTRLQPVYKMRRIPIDEHIMVTQCEFITYMVIGHQGKVSRFDSDHLNRELNGAFLRRTDGILRESQQHNRSKIRLI